MKITADESLAKHLGISEEQLEADMQELNEKIKEDIAKNTPHDESKLKMKVEF